MDCIGMRGVSIIQSILIDVKHAVRNTSQDNSKQINSTVICSLQNDQTVESTRFQQTLDMINLLKRQH